MKKVNLFLIIFSCINFSIIANKSLNVRVLLEEIEKKSFFLKIGQFDLRSKFIRSGTGEFNVLVPSQENEILKSVHLHVKFEDNKFIVNENSIESDRIIIRPCENTLLTINDIPYEGSLVLIKQPESIYLINVLNIENYVSSVLYGESWPGWSLRVNEVFAIMCRTYVSSKIFESRKKKNKYFDIKNTNHHQTYKGYHDFDILKQATLNTAGLILTHDQKPIIAMYDCCCGGIVPSQVKDVVNFEKAPYLARRYACNFCKDCKIYKWDIQYPLKDIEAMFKSEFSNFKKLKDIKIVSKDTAGMVKLVKLIDSAGKSITVTGKKVYSMLKKVKSLNFSIIKKGSNFVFKGKGYGHQMGLCQWGVHQLLKEEKNLHKWTADKVLKFYYPKTALMKIKA
ncbi:SpoIID/LytB domain-containing protein [Candidatus Dependentiae bacterium]|nr:SpoIID/LytB domain-containing protein [Candidatus Dependentiae bacterium]